MLCCKRIVNNCDTTWHLWNESTHFASDSSGKRNLLLEEESLEVLASAFQSSQDPYEFDLILNQILRSLNVARVLNSAHGLSHGARRRGACCFA